jgi:ATP-dependent Lon protease
MTGEVTLNGRVLPIGGVKQKLLAAHRAGLRTVFLPARNQPDLDEVPAEIVAELDVRLVSDVGEIVKNPLDGATAATPQPGTAAGAQPVAA